MKLVMTLLVRDEEDILREHLDYHLNAGVDLVIATDHRSRDGTTEILESYASAGVLHLTREDGEFSQQRLWQTRMSRLASSEFGADWIIVSDADEFWWPRGRSLQDVLADVPSDVGIVRGLVRNFVPLRRDDGSFGERMTIRLGAHAPVNDPATPFRPVVKVAHRGHPNVVVGSGGGHQVYGLPWGLLRGWYPLEVLHMPLRDRAQCARKYRKTWTGWEQNPRGDLARARQAFDAGSPDEIWERVALDESDLRRGLRDGSLVTDVRVRDTLRSLRGTGGEPVHAPHRAELDQDAFGAAVFEEAEIVRFQRWTDEVQRRVRKLEDPRRLRAR